MEVFGIYILYSKRKKKSYGVEYFVNALFDLSFTVKMINRNTIGTSLPSQLVLSTTPYINVGYHYNHVPCYMYDIYVSYVSV